MENLFEQMTNISKAHAYDILSKQVVELKEDCKNMKDILDDIIKANAKGEPVSIEILAAKDVLKNLKQKMYY